MRGPIILFCLFSLHLNAQQNRVFDRYGAITRGDTSQRRLYLIFTGHEYAEGGGLLCRTLKKEKVPGAFFFTGDFCRRYPRLVRKLKRRGFYVGPHSDKHLLYNDWAVRDSLLVSRDAFLADIRQNLATLSGLGIPQGEARWFIPPYEWYNRAIVEWCEAEGLRLFNFTPGTLSNADYTTDGSPNYRSSAEIYQSIVRYESTHQNGLNGFFLLSHIGAGPGRKDKFYKHIRPLIRELKARGYGFGQME
ncbi:MAG: polysaccharide deacetylase family protein [Phaeodactylibacter sp.]|nr:polysaccharide deacetylase family protein [Phaeodactylibacter sp.]